jgi:HEAT repeat protein
MYTPPILLGDPAAVPMLMRLLEHPSAPVRMAAALGLQSVGAGAKQAIPALLRVAKEDADLTVRFYARDAIRSIDPGAALDFPEVEKAGRE